MTSTEIKTYIDGLVKENATIPAKDALITQLKADNKSLTAQVKALTPKPPVVTVPIGQTTGLTSFADITGKTIVITPGTYRDKYLFTRLNDVVIDFNGAILESLTRVLEVNFFKNVILKNLNINGTINDYAIVVQGNEQATDINIDGLRITNVKATNTYQILHSGSAGLDKGIIKNIELDNWIIKDSPNLSSAAEIRNGQNVHIHHMTVQNVNSKNDNHNSIFFIIGSLEFNDCTYIDGQGNLLRLWPFSHGNVTEVSKIYNNSFKNSRKYGAFELQAVSGGNMPAGFKPSDVEIYNNYAENVGFEQTVYAGQMLDLYKTGGKVIYHNNTGKGMFTTDPQWHPITNDMINDEGGLATVTAYDNLYIK